MSNSDSPIKRRAWPEKRRKEQAKRCRQTRPWAASNGPKSDEGKARSCVNAFKDGLHSTLMIDLSRLLQKQKTMIKALQGGENRLNR